MKFKRTISYLSILPMVAGMINACGGSNPPSSPVKAQGTGSYEHCNQVFQQSIFDEYYETKDSSLDQQIAARYCGMETSEAMDAAYNTIQNSESSGSSSGGGGSLSVPAYLDLNGNTSKAKSMSRQEFKEAYSHQFESWKSQSCSSSSSMTESELLYSYQSKKVNSAIVNAWQQCISRESNGFTCSVKKNNDVIDVSIQYNRKVPKKLDLIWTLNNASYAGDPTDFKTRFNTINSIGTKSVQFVALSDKKSVGITVNAEGESHGEFWSFSCPTISFPGKLDEVKLPKKLDDDVGGEYKDWYDVKVGKWEFKSPFEFSDYSLSYYGNNFAYLGGYRSVSLKSRNNEVLVMNWDLTEMSCNDKDFNAMLNENGLQRASTDKKLDFYIYIKDHIRPNGMRKNSIVGLYKGATCLWLEITPEYSHNYKIFYGEDSDLGKFVRKLFKSVKHK